MAARRGGAEGTRRDVVQVAERREAKADSDLNLADAA